MEDVKDNIFIAAQLIVEVKGKDARGEVDQRIPGSLPPGRICGQNLCRWKILTAPGIGS
jgi:hypothetical protein